MFVRAQMFVKISFFAARIVTFLANKFFDEIRRTLCCMLRCIFHIIYNNKILLNPFPRKIFISIQKVVAVNRLFEDIKTLHYAATPHFDGFCFSISLQYNENGETQIFIFYELPTLFVFLCYFVGLYLMGTI